MNKKKINSPPKGEPWVWLTRELILSPAWQGLSINAQRVLFALLAEHMAHAGTENGNLMCTHEQLRHSGATSTCIRPAIEELAYLGLITFQRGGRWGGTNQPTIFRLTFYPDKSGNPATNEWKRVTEERVRAWCEHRKLLRPKKRKAAPAC